MKRKSLVLLILGLTCLALFLFARERLAKQAPPQQKNPSDA
ncbi:MAG: hypothetical protein ACE5IY_12770 [bacterium]